MELLHGVVRRKPFFRQMSGLILSLLVIQCPAIADLTINEHLVVKGAGPKYEWNRTIKIKGSKMRIESQHENEAFVTIYDLDSGQEMILQPKHGVANVFNLAEESAKLERRMKDVKSSIQPTGRKKQVLGMDCQDYKYDVQSPDPRHMIDGHLIASVQHVSGILCISPDAPGSQDLADFVRQLRDHNYVPGSISEETHVESESVLFLLIAPLQGLVLENSTESEVGGGSGVGLYGRAVVPNERLATVTSVTVETISESDFKVPTGWKIRKDRSMGLSVPVHKTEQSFPRVRTTDPT